MLSVSTAEAENRRLCREATVLITVSQCYTAAPLRIIFNVAWLCRGQVKLAKYDGVCALLSLLVISLLTSTAFLLQNLLHCTFMVSYSCSEFTKQVDLEWKSMLNQLLYIPCPISPLTCKRTLWLWSSLPISTAFSDFLWEEKDTINLTSHLSDSQRGCLGCRLYDQDNPPPSLQGRILLMLQHRLVPLH